MTAPCKSVMEGVERHPESAKIDPFAVARGVARTSSVLFDGINVNDEM